MSAKSEILMIKWISDWPFAGVFPKIPDLNSQRCGRILWDYLDEGNFLGGLDFPFWPFGRFGGEILFWRHCLPGVCASHPIDPWLASAAR
jgi:hypothetical protein